MSTRSILGAAVLAAAVGMTAPARADDDLRAMIRAEVESALATQKADKKDEKKDDNVFKVFWKNGLNLETADKNVKLKIGGRIMFDAAFYSDDDYNRATGVNLHDGVEFRRVRLYNSGQIGKHVKFKTQMDFADAPDEFSLKDVYIDFVDLRECLGCGAPDIQVGHFKVPWSLEEQTSSKYTTFLERSLANAFSPARLSGLMLHDALLGDQLTYGVGVFANGTEDGEDGDFHEDGYSLAARVTWTPWKDCDCECRLWHVGASFLRKEDIQELRYRSRAETHVTSHRPVDTGTFDAEGATHVGLETALVLGPWSIQGEYIRAYVDSVAAGDPEYSGWYVETSYWLTGECRAYKDAAFDRVKPCEDFWGEACSGPGAWQLAARVSSIDLNDPGAPGGEMMTYTLGVNWHLNANTRIMLNAVYADVDATRGAVPVNESFLAFQMRFQIDW
jgi:phosphate-selective porin OprO/OprP